MLSSRTWLLLTALVVLLPCGAQATPLGLQNGDVVTVLEWDADRLGVPGDGGDFTSTGTNVGDTVIDGRITSVELSGPVTNPLSGVDFVLSATLTSVTVIPLGGTNVLVNLLFMGVAGDDIVVTEGGNTILTAELDASGFTVGGVFDTAAPATLSPPAIANAVDIAISGGDPALVAALGGTGTLVLDGTLFDFAPSIGTILANSAIDEDFVYSGSGTISPTNPSAFVPEPAAALLVALGLTGLARRRKN